MEKKMIEVWDCPDCGFQMNAIHVDEEQSCPCCNEERLEAEVKRYREALEKIDTHIRSTSEPIPYIIETLKNTLPEYKEWWNIGE